MARLPNVTRDMVPEEFREAYDEVTGGDVITGGPGSITIYSPEMARRRAGLTAYLRYETTFPDASWNWPSSPRPGLWIAPTCGTPTPRLPAARGSVTP